MLNAYTTRWIEPKEMQNGKQKNVLHDSRSKKKEESKERVLKIYNGNI